MKAIAFMMLLALVAAASASGGSQYPSCCNYWQLKHGYECKWGRCVLIAPAYIPKGGACGRKYGYNCAYGLVCVSQKDNFKTGNSVRRGVCGRVVGKGDRCSGSYTFCAYPYKCKDYGYGSRHAVCGRPRHGRRGRHGSWSKVSGWSKVGSWSKHGGWKR